jgi:hypothetical protein
MRTFTRGASLALVVAIIFTSMAAGCTQSREPGASLVPSTASVGQGSGGGGSGTGSGGGTVQQAAGALYGDLYVIERDGNGEPKLTTGTYACQQPLAATCEKLPLNYEKGTCFNAELEDPCAVQTAQCPGEEPFTDYTAFLQAVSFGRESVARAPSTVLDKAYGEAIKSINAAVPKASRYTTDGDVDLCRDVDNIVDSRAIKLDPAGRITLCLATENVRVDPAATPTYTYAWKTIDAPLENLGLYRELMTSGCFNLVKDTSRGEEGTIIDVYYVLSETARLNLDVSKLGHLACAGPLPVPQTEPTPHEIVTKADMLSAAVFLAAGADKTSPVTLDEVINLNNYVGVNTWTYTTVRKVKTLSITYFKFDAFTYKMGTDACQTGTVNPDNIVTLLTTPNGKSFELKDVDVFGGSPDGVALRPGAAVTVCRDGFPLRVGSVNLVCDDSSASGCGGANWFTQAAEDARKTIWFLHNYEPPAFAY